MEEHIVKVLSVEPLTHDVKRIRVEKPEGYRFTPGQATEVAVNDGKWKTEARPFTFTGLNSDSFLEFSIKSYRNHDGVTNRIDSLKTGDELILHDVWGAIHYKGPGVFIAGGAGITPFIAIFKDLTQNGSLSGNQLIFANKTEKDIILKEDFQKMLGGNFINILSDEQLPQYDYGMISQAYLQEKIKDFKQNFYICGPDPMVQAIQKYLQELGAADTVITVEV